MLEQCENLVVGLRIFGHYGLQKAMEQGHHDSNVLACPSKAREGFIVCDDPLVHITGHGACAPTVSVTFNLPIDLRVFPHKLESGFIDLPLSGS